MSQFSIEGKTLQALLKFLFNLQVNVPELGRLNPTKLSGAGEYIARHYLHSTTSTEINLTKTREWWVKDLEPLLFIQQSLYDSIEAPYRVRHVPYTERYGIRLFHAWVRLDKNRYGLWGMTCSESEATDMMRKLRVFLLRIHAEQMCLRYILQLLATEKLRVEPKSDESQLLQMYLNDATRKIGRLHQGAAKSFGSDLSAFVWQIADFVNPGQRDSLLRSLEIQKIRHQIVRKIEKITESKYHIEDSEVIIMEDRSVHVSGEGHIVNVNSVITDSFNKVRASNAQDELKVTLMELKDLVEQLITDLDKGQAEAAARNVSTLTTEAVSSSPQKPVIKGAAESLLALVPKGVEYAVKITNVIAKIIGFF